MGNTICKTEGLLIESRSYSQLHNHDPQSIIRISHGIPNVSSQCLGHPQQNRFEFNDVIFESRFESGNLAQAERVETDDYDLWIAPDCYKTKYQAKYQAWFYFRVELKVLPDPNQARVIKFRIRNLDLSQRQYFSAGLKPVFSPKGTNDKWEYLNTGVSVGTDKDFISVSFEYKFTSKDTKAYFAYSFPYTYKDLNDFLFRMEKNVSSSKKMLFQREVLAKSIEERNIELITITGKDSSSQEKSPNNLSSIISEKTSGESHETQPHTHRKIYSDRKYVLITCRSQASDTSSSYMLESFIKALLSSDSPQYQALRENFVFLIVPMLNPDGVARGHTITDIRGRNLGSSYTKKMNKDHYPGLYALKELVKDLKLGLHMYWELESSLSKVGVSLKSYMTGDNSKDAEGAAVARLFDLYSKHFVLSECRLAHSEGFLKPKRLLRGLQAFKKANEMLLENKEPTRSLKQQIVNKGSMPQKLEVDYKSQKKNSKKFARNFIARLGGTHLSFTLRVNLFKGKKRPDKHSFYNIDSLIDIENKSDVDDTYPMTTDHMREVGESLLDVILEYNSYHQKPILPSTRYGSIDKLKFYSLEMLKIMSSNDLRNTIA